MMSEFNPVRARGVAARLVELDRAVHRAEAQRFLALAEFADEYRAEADGGPVLDGMERTVKWGGDGTPEVAEFCVLELSALWGVTPHLAQLQIGDVLAVRHRLPSVWRAIEAGRVRVWAAIDLAHAIRPLTLEEALQIDQEIAPDLGHMSRRRLLRYVKGRVTDMRPKEAQSEHEELKKQCGVEFGEPHQGFTQMWAVLPATEAVFLKARLDQVAVLLGKCRPEGALLESMGMRRALALGVLASPALGLQMLQGAAQDELPTLDAECPAAGLRGHTCGAVTTDPEKLLPIADVVVHLTDGVLRDGEGVARSEQLGPLLAGWTKELLGHTRVRVRPVLDAGNQVPTDSYECPARMREAVELRNPYEVFPFSQRPSAGCDMDHTVEWRHRRGAEMPLTRSDNLGPLSRWVHRLKTFGGWSLDQVRPGVFLWTSKLGFGYLVTPSRSWMITDPTGRILERPEEPVEVAV
ncbi:hypothetical protein [Aestuariimicrobium sp. Y1814]|uniref:hypothetical protein n=1 Tax=Aestuariimicrobium sp. Y1814 TaxID=3418742 RepID=UPI003DA6EF31